MSQGSASQWSSSGKLPFSSPARNRSPCAGSTRCSANARDPGETVVFQPSNVCGDIGDGGETKHGIGQDRSVAFGCGCDVPEPDRDCKGDECDAAQVIPDDPVLLAANTHDLLSDARYAPDGDILLARLIAQVGPHPLSEFPLHVAGIPFTHWSPVAQEQRVLDDGSKLSLKRAGRHRPRLRSSPSIPTRFFPQLAAPRSTRRAVART
jgi:hypothetical protein